MSVELFLSLLISSVAMTIVLTQLIKKVLIASNTPYRTHAVVLDSAMVSSTGVGVIYRIPFGLGFAPMQLIRLLLLIICTWFVSMLVYDKIVQTKEQYRKYKEQKEKGKNA